MKVMLVCGARPNFIKLLPLLAEIRKFPQEFIPILVHTGQHYDYEMSKIFFEDLLLPEPDIHLGVGSFSHAEQTARIMISFEEAVLAQKPDLVIVVGDVNSTLACSLVVSKIGIPLAHIEAGLRSFDRRMPEEINRILTDRLADYLFTPFEEANENLIKEGTNKENIYLVGNIMMDSLILKKDRINNSKILENLGVGDQNYALLTLHRPSNVDIEENLAGILDAINVISERINILFPVHPRTKKRIEEFKLSARTRNLVLLNALGYLDFLCFERHAKFVLTDSGGMQAETTFLGVPCLTLRESTEWTITLIHGTNVLVGIGKEKIIEESFKILDGIEKDGKPPSIWDGKTSERIVRVLRKQK